MKDIVVKLAEERDWDAAIGVAWTTFKQVSSQICDEKAVVNFRDGLTSTQLYIEFLQGRYPLFCAYECGKVIGMLTLRDMAHISLFFVKKEFQGRGIGKMLLTACKAYCRENGISDLTVNAAPTGLPFYRANGFESLSEERFEDGLWFTPMTLKA